MQAAPHPNTRDQNAAREAAAERYARVRAASLARAAPLSDEDQVVQSMPDASPVKWHLAHTSWFFETFILRDAAQGYRLFSEDFPYLFNSYYEAEGARHPRAARGLLTRPGAAEVRAYRAHVDGAMDDFIRTASDEAFAAVAALIDLGLHHEEQHQELILMDVKHLLSLNPLAPAYARAGVRETRTAAPLCWRAFEGGLTLIGHAGEGFAFDNETPRHKVYLEPFALADRLASNAEYEAFIEDGGYDRPAFWLADGFATARAEGWTAPLYWCGEAGARRVFTLEGERPLDPGEPVAHVSFYEADAFARWSGKRLPTEAEWEHAAATRRDLAGLSGALWQWTSSPYTAYPRFRPAPGAVGEYNGKFMSGQMVLRGGSFATPEGHARHTYRNFFPPAARWAFSGVRLADDL